MPITKQQLRIFLVISTLSICTGSDRHQLHIVVFGVMSISHFILLGINLVTCSCYRIYTVFRLHSVLLAGITYLINLYCLIKLFICQCTSSSFMLFVFIMSTTGWLRFNTALVCSTYYSTWYFKHCAVDDQLGKDWKRKEVTTRTFATINNVKRVLYSWQIG